MPRHGHIAIIYRTYGYEYCAKFVEIDICSDYNIKNLTCPVCVANEENKLERNKLVDFEKKRGVWLGPEDENCPMYCCPL